MFARRIPFRSFAVELTSGDQFQVLHPEALALNNGVAVYIGIEETLRIFGHQSVSQFIGMVDAQPDQVPWTASIRKRTLLFR